MVTEGFNQEVLLSKWLCTTYAKQSVIQVVPDYNGFWSPSMTLNWSGYVLSWYAHCSVHTPNVFMTEVS